MDWDRTRGWTTAKEFSISALCGSSPLVTGPVCHNSLGIRLVYLTLITCFLVPLFQHQEKRHAESWCGAKLLFDPVFCLFPPARRAWSQGVAGLIENDNIILTTCIEKIERYLLKIRLNVYWNVNFWWPKYRIIYCRKFRFK